ncbi:cyclin-like protein [Phycomyces blakesleeanus]|uniref:Cyclin-like protein n=2 Tax=Phycomyces blakesleeanus TaxID=4837 RepID=A0ABR3B2Y7_PHYBL
MYGEAQRLNSRRSAASGTETNENALAGVAGNLPKHANTERLTKPMGLTANLNQRSALFDKSNVKPNKGVGKPVGKGKAKGAFTDLNQKPTTERTQTKSQQTIISSQPTKQTSESTVKVAVEHDAKEEEEDEEGEEETKQTNERKKEPSVTNDTQQPKTHIDNENPINQEMQDFFDDNAERYKQKDNPEIEPVPILPIIVPEHLKDIVFKKSEKRIAEPHARDPQKRLRHIPTEDSTGSRSDIFSNANTTKGLEIEAETLKEAEEYDRLQETRAKQAALQSSQTLKDENWNDPMLVAEYAEDIFKILRESEVDTMADPTYVSSQQHEVTWRMRGVLIDWVVEIHHLFELLPETLFLTVNLIDRFLSRRAVVLSKLQLVGITSLYIATKFEEVTAPVMEDFLFMTDQSIQVEDLLKAERFILQVLDFKLCYSNPLSFMRRTSMGDSYDVHTRMLAKYFMEITCVDHRFLNTKPSLIAAAALWLSQKMLSKGIWTPEMSRLAGYQVPEIKPTVELMLDFLSHNSKYEGLFRKWSSKRLMKASIFARDWIKCYYLI